MEIILENWVVKLKKGMIRGCLKKEDDFNYYCFLGIRYGQAPKGDLRFKAPLPVEPWTIVLDAFEPGSMCIQYESLVQKEWTGSEDCLFLNVFIPGSSKKDTKTFCPVFVYIHGGGYTHGSGEHYSPQYFMKNNSIILVTLNYRLGPLGFCNLETTDIPGNAGLYDILLALKWVQENIIHFNGDPNNITLCGFSAGAGAAHLLALSPLSKGLLHRVILISGCALNSWVAKPSCKWNSFQLARVLGFTGNNDDIASATSVLKNAPAIELFKKMNQVYTNGEENEEVFDLVFVPNWKTGYSADNTFFPLSLTELIPLCKIPILFGMASLEGGGLIDEIQMKPELNTIFSKTSELLVPQYIRNLCNENKERIRQNAIKIKKYFFKSELINSEISQNLLELISDQSFIVEICQCIRIHAASSSSIYIYLFDQDIPSNSFGRYLFRLNNCDFTKIHGAFHGDDQRYLFPLKEIFPRDLNKKEENLMKNMISIFCNFSKNGKPPSKDNLSSWKPYKNEHPNFLQIVNYSFHIKNEPPFKERNEFWNQILSEIN